LTLDKDSDDEGSEVRSNLGVRFVYRVDDRKEARKACDILGIPASDDNLEILTSRMKMESGDFLMKDFDGRVGLVRFPLDEINPQLYEAFRTDSEANKRREAAEFAEWKNKNYTYERYLVWKKRKEQVVS
jgi:hypothetical protein